MSQRALLGAVGYLAFAGRGRVAIRPSLSALRRLKLFNANTGGTFAGSLPPHYDGVISSAAAELLRDGCAVVEQGDPGRSDK
jgi:hypothetical protein